MSNNKTSFVALLVGIDQWQNEKVPPLSGCISDVGLMSDVLKDSFNIPDENLCVLVGEEASRAGIERAFREHLINRAKKMPPAELESTAFLFHYSGHGSRAIDSAGTTGSGFDETIVPQDSRTNNVFDIKDWELGSWIDELTEKTTNVTIILDCCHSGSGTRTLSESGDPLQVLPGRQCLPDLRSQPIKAGTRSTPKTDEADKSNRYTLLASCRSDEIANELPKAETGAAHAHGVMTYHLARELAHLPARDLTYRELHERLRHQVNKRFPRQMPQCEGDRDRIIFGGVRPARSALRTVVDIRDGYHWIDTGQAHGITEGTVLDVYPPSTRSLTEGVDSIGQLVVEEVGAVRSACSVRESSAKIEVSSRVAVKSVPQVATPRRIQLICGDDSLRQTLQTRFNSPDTADLVKFDTNESTGTVDAENSSDRPADIVLRKIDGDIQVEDGGNRLIPTRYAIDKLDKLARDVIHRARFQNALEVCNNAPDSNLAGALQISLKQLGFDPETQEPIATELPPVSGGETVVQVGDRIVIQLTNHSKEKLYLYLFNFAHDGAIAQVYPRARGAQEVLAPGRTMSIGMSRKKSEQIWVQPQGVSEAAEQLKLFGTIDETSFEVLEQGPLATTRLSNVSTLGKLLAQAAGGVRGLGSPPNSAEDNWTTAELDFRIIQPTSESTHQITGDKETRIEGYDLEVSAPDGFSGEISVMTSRQGERCASNESGNAALSLRGPSVLEASDLFSPFTLPATVRAAPDASCITITCDDAAREKVTDETPLRIKLPRTRSDISDDLLVIAHDGELYYPVGNSSADSVSIDIDWLPPEPKIKEGETGSTRSIGRGIRLYVYRLLNITSQELGLHRARFFSVDDKDDGTLEGNEYPITVPTGLIKTRKLRKADLKSGQRCVLFVHGFQSDTRWMIEGPGQMLKEKGIQYDQFLTFDYESYGTSIDENAKTLAAQLKDAGFGPDDGVYLDIISHNMGGLLSRAMIELHGGAKFVDRCVLVGVPNSGTLLAESLRLAPWLGTLIVNATGTLPVAALAGLAIKKVLGDANGLGDLRPTSKFINSLKTAPGDGTVAYQVLAGNYSMSGGKVDWSSIAQRALRMTRSVLDNFFGDDHDLVMSTRSMLSIRDGNVPPELIDSATVPSDHYSYFVEPKSQEILVQWLRETKETGDIA